MDRGSRVCEMIRVGRIPLLVGGLFVLIWQPVLAQRSVDVVDVTVLDFRLTCDRQECRTPVLELHENTGTEANSVAYVFAPPPDITLDDGHTTGIEVEGSGETHYVRAVAAGPTWLKCHWLAKARSGGEPGLSKGYCWIGRKK